MTNSGTNCCKCKSLSTINATEADTGLRDYFCDKCFYYYVNRRVIATMPEFLRKYYFKKS